jgi:glycosyltransferase involved in cell wall biosynthesis
VTPGDALGITMLSPRYWPEVRRGTERTIHGLSQQLLARGHRVRLITSAPARRFDYAVEDGLPILRVPRLSERRFERRMHETHLMHVPFAYAALRHWGGDIAHAWYQTDALAAARWKRKTGKPALFSYMGVPDPPGLQWRRRRLEITLDAVRGCDAIVGVSEFVAANFKRWLGVDAHTVYPPIDVDGFVPRPELKTEEPTIFCAAGADEFRKRLPLLAQAHQLVRREHPEAKLWLFDPRTPKLRRPLELPGVEFVDAGPNAERLPELYASSWVGALPSIGDAFGMVLAESLACGTPVVATNRDALPEVVDRPEIGVLFDGDQPEDLARALLEAIELARDPGTAAACRARAEDFAPARTADGYEQIYRDLL